MMLGKRQRGPIRRTTSMKGINVDLNDVVEVSEPSDYLQSMVINGYDGSGSVVLGGPGGFDHRVTATASPRYNHKGCTSGGGGGERAVVLETAHFLKTCGLCNRRLTTGCDIYMYRGDAAFCSQECREEQMKHDERKERCSLAANSKKSESHRHHSPPNTASTAATSEV